MKKRFQYKTIFWSIIGIIVVISIVKIFYTEQSHNATDPGGYVAERAALFDNGPAEMWYPFDRTTPEMEPSTFTYEYDSAGMTTYSYTLKRSEADSSWLPMRARVKLPEWDSTYVIKMIHCTDSIIYYWSDGRISSVKISHGGWKDTLFSISTRKIDMN